MEETGVSEAIFASVYKEIFPFWEKISETETKINRYAGICISFTIIPVLASSSAVKRLRLTSRNNTILIIYITTPKIRSKNRGINTLLEKKCSQIPVINASVYKEIFPFWEKISETDRDYICENSYVITYSKGIMASSTQEAESIHRSPWCRR